MASQPIFPDQFGYLLPLTNAKSPTEKYPPVHDVAIPKDGTDGGCGVCGIISGWNPLPRQLEVQLRADLPAPALVEAMVLGVTADATYRYAVGQDALRALLLGGRVEWYPPGPTFGVARPVAMR